MPFLRRKSRKPQVAGRQAALVKTGTTYKAGQTALAQIPRPNLDSEIGSGQPIFIRDIVPELTTPFQRTQAYAQMMTDASVDVSVRVVKTPILGAEFFMEPYSDDPLDKLVAQFAWENLAKGMSAPLLNSLEDILRMYEDGYSVIEKVYENREWSPSAKGANSKQYTMLKKLGVRPANTIIDIEYDNNGGPKTITQNAIQGDGSVVEKKMDISKLMVFTFNRKGGDLTGKSILRTAYPHWFYKNHMYKMDAVQKERHGIGVPRGTLLQGADAQDREILRTLLRNLRTNEEAFIIQTSTVQVDFAQVQGQLVNIIESADHHTAMIMLNVMGQFMTMGVVGGGGGGRATAGASSDLFMKSLKYVANYIAQVVNMYLIPELVVWNFPTKNFPQLKVRNIGETRDLQMFAAGLANLFAQSALTSDPDTENWIRDVFDMPHKSAAVNIPGTPTKQVIGTNGATQPPPVGPLDSPAPSNGNQKGGITPNAIKTGNVGKPPNAAQ